MFISIERRISIPKIVEKEGFLMKPKCQYHLSQWEECVYGAHQEKKCLSKLKDELQF